jgi:uncharacterized damage-inducible protein DinB
MVAAMTDLRLDWAPHWRVMNTNLIELVDLVPDEHLGWVPREGEWAATTIFAHIAMARYMGPLGTPEAMARIGQLPLNCRTKAGAKDELARSWELIERFLSDPAKLDAKYPELSAGDSYYDEEPEPTGHYLLYHRFAHDLHHRSTVIGYLAQLRVALDGHRIRPL